MREYLETRAQFPTTPVCIDPKTGKAMLRPVMQWAHRDADPNTLKWLLSHQYSDEFGDAPDKVVSITAITNDQTMKTIATRVEAYQKKRGCLRRARW
jgi:hypothetical protein